MSFMTFPDTDTPQRDAVLPALADLYADLFTAAMPPWAWVSAWWQPWALPDFRLDVLPGAPVHEVSRPFPVPDAALVIEVVPVVVPTAPEAAAAAAAPASADDLTRIEGIGPKMALKLGEAGLTTFAALAATPVERLEALIAAAGARFKLVRPQTWPEQAALLAAGDETGFAALTAQLKGGRRA
jgi:predicted flap endonuclease-1-like 5' DNA nuclease